MSKEPKNKAGAHTPLFYEDGVVGVVLRTKQNVKPLFISTGVKIDLESSVKVILSCTRGYRNPEPIRFVDQWSRKYSKSL